MQDVIDVLLPTMIRNWLWMCFSVVAVFIVITINTPIFIAVGIPIIIIYYFVQKFYVATSRQLKRLESVTRSPIYSHFGESISGQSVIRAYDDKKRFTVESELKVDFNQAISYQTIIANRWLGVRLEILGSFVVLSAALFAVLARDTIGKGKFIRTFYTILYLTFINIFLYLTVWIASVGLSISYALQISQLMSFFVRMTTEVETNIVAVERVEEYTDRPQEAAWKTVEMVWSPISCIVITNFISFTGSQMATKRRCWI